MHKWALIWSIAGSVSATCYYPDGTDATTHYDYQPCGNTSTTYSTCCYFGEGDKCLPNELCDWQGHFEYRAACQDKDWANCPEVCLGTKSGTWLALNKCGADKYCCPSSQGADCCDHGSRIYSLVEPTAKPTPVPVGAIADGVVGGVTVMGLLFLGGLYFFKHRGSKPALLPTRPALAADTADSNSPSGGNIKQEEPTARSGQYSGLCEAEGNAANMYTEADSQPINVADFAVRRQNDSQSATEQNSEKPQTQQQILAETEGSPGNLYVEADSRSITTTRLPSHYAF